MCGICGIMNIGDVHNVISRSLIEQMTNTMVHRGPNDHGIWTNETIAFGHRRLSVIDLSRDGRQPMGNEDGQIQITYNGEVYNFQELKEKYNLVERGHQFRSRTDTEVLVHLYEELGLEMLAELNGMFAFAIWDGPKKLLHLVRDPYGVKPLFYHRDDRFFRFASEIKAILADHRVPKKASIQALHDYLTFDYVPGQQTSFEGIYEVPPAHCMTIDAEGRTNLRRYWGLSYQVDESIDEKSAVNSALELMNRSVKRQLIADVPIGVLLSGGMDSSALVALMRNHTSEPIRTYSIGFEDQSFNELPYARIVSEGFGCIRREVIVTAQMIRDLLPKYLSYIDEPYADGSAIPTYYVCQIAKDDVVVVLSGEGGDEAFAGYDTYMAYLVSTWAKKVPRWIRNSLISPVVHCLPVSEKKLSLEFKMKRFLGGLDLSPAQAHLWWRIVLTESQKFNLYTSEVTDQLVPENSDRYFIELFTGSGAKDVISKLLHIDTTIFLPDDLMVKNDRMSMAHSLEARVPFTDPELTEYMSRVPNKLKLSRFRKKHIMRKSMEGILPAEILNKKKVGLEIPYSKWLKDELKDLLLTYLGPERVSETRLFRPEAVKEIVDEHIAGYRDNGRALWGLLNYMMWYEMYIS